MALASRLLSAVYRPLGSLNRNITPAVSKSLTAQFRQGSRDSIHDVGLPPPLVTHTDAAICSVIGRREYQEDRSGTASFKHNVLYIGVFDGHGGSLAAEYTMKNMPGLIEEALAEHAGNYQQVLEQAFQACNKALLEHIRHHKPSRERYSGTTATVCLLVDNIYLHTASVGDSRAILCREHKAVPLTEDHSPDRDDEKRRVEAAGASVISNSLGEPMVNGRLAMTRSIGDFDLKKYGVSPIPDSKATKVNHSKDSFLVLVTDGVTCSMSNQEIVDVISTCSDVHSASQKVVDSALELRSHDNATALVLPLGAWAFRMPTSMDIMHHFGRSLGSRD